MATKIKTGSAKGGTAKVTKAKPGRNDEIIKELIVSYWMEIETVQNYLAHSINLDGVRAKEIRESLGGDIQEELGHAQRLAERIHILGGLVPGSAKFKANQTSLQPSSDTTDLASVIKGVIDAEDTAIAQYKKIIELTEGEDYATQDLCIELMADEQGHRREFVGFLLEVDKKSAEKYGI